MYTQWERARYDMKEIPQPDVGNLDVVIGRPVSIWRRVCRANTGVHLLKKGLSKNVFLDQERKSEVPRRSDSALVYLSISSRTPRPCPWKVQLVVITRRWAIGADQSAASWSVLVCTLMAEPDPYGQRTGVSRIETLETTESSDREFPLRARNTRRVT